VGDSSVAQNLAAEIKRLRDNRDVIERNIQDRKDEAYLVHISETGSVEGGLGEYTYMDLRRLLELGWIDLGSTAGSGSGGYIVTEKGKRKLSFLNELYGDG
jgi:hypothetical protein